MAPAMRDTRPVECKFFDRDDKLFGTVSLPPRRVDEPPRKVVFRGRAFIEGDGTGFYGADEFSEVVE